LCKNEEKKISKSLLIRKMKYEGTIKLGCLRITSFGQTEENTTFEKLGV